MRQLFVSIFIAIVLLHGLNSKGQAQGGKEPQVVISADYSVSDNYSYASGYSDIFNHAANKETSQGLVQRLFPTFQKFPFGGLFTEKCAEIAGNNEISDYIYNAEYQVIRFEGPDIINPFNYFW